MTTATLPERSDASRDRVRVRPSRGAPTAHGSPQTLMGLGLLCLGVGVALLLGLFPIRGLGEVRAMAGAVMALAGISMAWGGMRVNAIAKSRVAPWRADGFTGPVITPGFGLSKRRMAIQALLCFAFGAVLLRGAEPGSPVGFMGWLLVAAGAGTVFYMAWHAYMAWKFGRCRLVIRSLPTSPGETLELAFRGDRALAGADIEFRLECVEQELRMTSNRNGGTKTVAYRIYEDRRVAHTAADGSAALTFGVPAELPGTRMRAGSAEKVVYWRLLATAAVPGIDFEGEFLLPIYRH